MAGAPNSESELKSLKDALTNDFTQCSICMEDYKLPKMLPCLHNFCQHCLVGYIQAKGNPKEFPCPLCQEATVVPPGGISSLRSNFFIQNLQEVVGLLAKDKKCDMCKENGTSSAAASFCVDCKDNLCQDCARSHCNTRFTRGHQVILMENLSDKDIQEKIRSSQDVFCPAHKGKVVEYFCKPCQTPICRDCTVLDHHGHKCQSLQEAADNFKKTLQPQLQKLQDAISKFTQSKSAIIKQRESLNKMRQTTDQSIKQWEFKVAAQIKQRAAELLEESRATFDVEVKKLQASQDEIELRLGILQSTRNLGNNIMQQGHDAEILFLHGQLTERMKQLESEQEQPPRIDTETCVTLETSLIDLTSTKLIRKNYIDPPRVVGAFDSKLIRKQSSVKPNYIDPPQIVGTFKSKTKSNTSISHPNGVAVLGNGDIAIADYGNSQVKLFDSHGLLKWEVGLNAQPHNVIVTRDNSIMVFKASCSEIDVLSVKGQIIRHITTNVKCSHPGLAILDENRIVITDSDKKCFHICDSDGTVTKTVYHKLFQCPHYVACSLNDNIIISDNHAHIVVIFNQEGTHITTYGTPGTEGSGPGQLCRPWGVCTDRYNNIIVADAANRRVVLLDSEAHFIRDILTKSDLGFRSTRAVTVTPDDCLYLTVTSNDGLVRKVKYLA